MSKLNDLKIIKCYFNGYMKKSVTINGHMFKIIILEENFRAFKQKI